MGLVGRDIVCNIRHSTRIKIYDNGSIDVLSCDKPIFGRAGWEAPFGSNAERKRVSVSHHEGADGQGDVDRAVRRAKARVRDIAVANDFQWFVTLTLDQEKIDRYDVKTITRKLSAWCDNQVRRHGLRYVLIPERHKDGAIHFHGFMSWDGEGDFVVESGTFTKTGWAKPRKARSAAQAAAWRADGAKPVFNLPKWTLGFSTAIAVYGEYGAAVGYVCKYVGKQMEGGKIGGRWYYSGGKLREPRVELCDLSLTDFDGLNGMYEFTVEAVGRMRLWRGKSDDFTAAFGSVLDGRAWDDFQRTFYPTAPVEVWEGEFDAAANEIVLGDDVDVPFD